VGSKRVALALDEALSPDPEAAPNCFSHDKHLVLTANCFFGKAQLVSAQIMFASIKMPLGF